MTLYKFLNEDGTSCNGGSGRYHLPTDEEPGEWMPSIEGELVPCTNGYHVCREQDLVRWIGPALFIAEAGNERIVCDSKIVVRDVRLVRRLDGWNAQSARMFACDCAERVLHLFEERLPDDKRPRACIETARRFALGEASKEELNSARLASYDAAYTAYSALYAAADAADAAACTAAAHAVYAATYAASFIVYAAAPAAAHATAADEEIKWQTDLLLKYIEDVQ